MLRLAADEDFNHDILRGLRRKLPAADITSVQEAGLSGADDPEVLAWAAEENRVLLSHDVNTLTKHAYERIIRGERMPGVFEVSRDLPIGGVVRDLVLLVECSLDGEWEGQVRFLPLR